MKHIWVRVGMLVSVTNDEYEEIRERALRHEETKEYGYSVYKDVDLYDCPEWFLKRLKERGDIDGDSYISSEIWD